MGDLLDAIIDPLLEPLIEALVGAFVGVFADVLGGAGTATVQKSNKATGSILGLS